MSLPLTERFAFFDGVERRRGEAARNQLEARWILEIPFEHRKTMLNNIEEHRGRDKRGDVEREVRRIFYEGKSSA